MTISLTPEIEAVLRDRANQEGCDLDTIANAIIKGALDWEAQERAETIAALEEGMKAIAEGRERPFKEFMREHYERWPDPKT